MIYVVAIGDRKVVVPVLCELLDCVQAIEKPRIGVVWWIVNRSKGDLMSQGRLLFLFEHIDIDHYHFFLLLKSLLSHHHYVRVSRFAIALIRIRIFEKSSNIFQFFVSDTRVSFADKCGLCEEIVGILRGLIKLFGLDIQKHAGVHESARISLCFDVVEVDASV